MPPATNPIDITTLASVKAWAGATNTSDDQQIQDAITAFSAMVLRTSGRGPQNSSIPAQSPFVVPVAYTEIYDGNGSERLYLRNWPIGALTAVSICGIAQTISSGFGTAGIAIDSDGESIVFIPGPFSGPPTFWNTRWWSTNGGRRGIGNAGFALGIQNIQVSYTGGFYNTPFDLEMCARKVVALNYKRRQWIGQKSQVMAGVGQTNYNGWEMDADCVRVIQYYTRRARV